MSLPLLIRQIFADLIINGSKQKFRFRSEPEGTFQLLNEHEITELLPSITNFEMGDFNQNSFIWRYLSNSNLALNELGLYVKSNNIVDSSPILKINQATKQLTFVSPAYYTKDDGTTALIGSGGSGSSITQDDIDNILQQAKDFTQTNKYNKIEFTPTNNEPTVDWTDDSNTIHISPILNYKVREDQGNFNIRTFTGYNSNKEVIIRFELGRGLGIYTSLEDTADSSWTYFTHEHLDLYNKKIIRVVDPENDQDVSTKKYTDTQDQLIKDWIAENYATIEHSNSKGVSLEYGYFSLPFNSATDDTDDTQLVNVGNDYVKDRSQIWEMKIRNLVRDGLDDPGAGDEVFFIRQPYMSGLQIGVTNNNLENNSDFYDSATQTYGLVHIHLKNYECNFTWDNETQTASDKIYNKTYKFKGYSENYGKDSAHRFYNNVSYFTQNQNGTDNSYGNWKINTQFGDLVEYKTHIKYNSTNSRWEHIKNDLVFNGYPQTKDANYQPTFQSHLTNKGYVDLGRIPIGSEIVVPKNIDIPDNFLKCDGSDMSRTTYEELGSIYATAGRSTTYVNGQPMITLPDRSAPDDYSMVIVRAK